MTQEQFNCEKRYQTAMSVVRSMLESKVISSKHAKKLEEVFRQKYQPVIGPLLYSDIPINSKKEVT